MFKAGVDESKIIRFLQKKLKDGGLKRKLTVIDPYFFSDGRFSFTQKVIRKVLSPFTDKIEELEIVTKIEFNKANFLSLRATLHPLAISVVHENDFHDRFWIIDQQKAFLVGTSINGFGNKHFYIQDDFLSDKDTRDIISFYK